MFNYGTIVIVGTGGTQNTFKVVQKPLEFRKVVKNKFQHYRRSSNNRHKNIPKLFRQSIQFLLGDIYLVIAEKGF